MTLKGDVEQAKLRLHDAAPSGDQGALPFRPPPSASQRHFSAFGCCAPH